MTLIGEMAEIIRNGGTVVFPTETVYGIGANALDPGAVAGIFAAKGRPPDNPLIVHIADISQIETVAPDVPDVAYKLMERFWPGPLTLILKKSPKIPSIVTAGLETVAVRVPKHRVAYELIMESKLPIAAPSANISGKPSPTKTSHVINDLFGKVDAIIDCGQTQIGLESTVLDLTAQVPAILRPGGVTREELEEVLGEALSARTHSTQPQHTAPGQAGASVKLLRSQSPAVRAVEDQRSGDRGRSPLRDTYRSYDFGLNCNPSSTPESLNAPSPTEADINPPRSPGMKYKHYAPDAKMVQLTGSREQIAARINLLTSRISEIPQIFTNDPGSARGEGRRQTGLIKIGVLATDELFDLLNPNDALISVSMGNSGSLGTLAGNLFDSLRKLDELNVDIILAESFPQNGLGYAIMDRLNRAASGRIIKTGEYGEILFVCTGNTCRSCMAEAFFNYLMEECGIGKSNTPVQAPVFAKSAGINAIDNDPASEAAINVMAENWGISLAEHRARTLTGDMIAKADLILTMGNGHKSNILRTYPDSFGKVFTILEFTQNSGLDITDPFGWGREVYEKCSRQIKAAVDKLVEIILP